MKVKIRSVQEANISPMVFQVYSAIAVSITSLVVLTYNKFLWSWWGVLGAGLWMCSQPFAFAAINLVGYALGPAIWAGTTIVVSFIWGVTLFGEEIGNIGLSILGIVILILGISGVTGSGTRIPHRIKEKIMGYSSLVSPTDEKEETSGQTKRMLLGIASALIMGVMNGSLMVPFTLYVEEQEGNENEGSGQIEFVYLVSFSLGIILVTPPVFLIYCLVTRSFPQFNPKIALIPGLTTGVLWSIGNFASLYATLYLGNTVGYPLTQACILVSGLLGVFLFKEIKGPAIFMFSVSAAILLGGAAMLAVFGSS